MLYKIKKGNHRSGLHFSPCLFKEELKFSFKLSNECWFNKVNTDDWDINKIYGVSFGYHHKNSIRLGWVPSDHKNMIDLYAYYYNDSARRFDKICTIYAGQEYHCTLINKSDINLFEIKIYKDSLIANIIKDFKYPSFKIGYKLFPYFGGDNVAAKDLTVEII